MADFTGAIGSGLDAKRRVFGRGDSELLVLNHRSAGGYDKVCPVPVFWHIAEGDDFTGQIILRIAESETVLKADLDRARAFSIDNEVYRIRPGSIGKPVNPARRVWKFGVEPTGEKYP